MLGFSRYANFRDSGVEWLGKVPRHWSSRKLKHAVTLINDKVNTKDQDRSFIGLENIESWTGRILNGEENTSEGIATSFEPDDVVFGKLRPYLAKVFLARRSGVVSTEALVFRCGVDVVPAFLRYFLVSPTFIEIVNSSTYGTKMPRASWDYIGNQLVLLPPLSEQARIAAFLDEKTAEIDDAIAKKQRLIELLQEQKAILINRAVTQGLDPNVSMRDSGVAWIGQVPAHWEVKRAKFLFTEVNERSETGSEELLSVSHVTGVTPRSEKNVNMFMAEDYTGSKLCRRDDLVFNIMWAWMGALGVSDRTGIVSSSYGVYRQKQAGTFNSWYLEHLLRSTEYVAEYNRRSTGLHSSRLRLYPDMFFDMELSIPPRHEQDLIETVATERTALADQAIHAVEREIQTLNEFRSILISDAVTGKIKV